MIRTFFHRAGRCFIAVLIVTVLFLWRVADRLGLSHENSGKEDVDRSSMRHAYQKAHAVVNGYEWTWDEE